MDPPKIGSCIVDQLWDRLLPKRYEGAGSTAANTSYGQPDISERIKEMDDSPSIVLDRADLAAAAVSRVVLKRSVNRRKGDWYQIPKSVETQNDLQ